MSPWGFPILGVHALREAAHDPLIRRSARRLAAVHATGDDGYCRQCGQESPCFVRLFTDPILSVPDPNDKEQESE